jgi:hypothetical protein
MAISDVVPIYARSSRKTKLCMRRKKTRYGNIYRYIPRVDLLRNVALEFGISEEKARERIAQERRYLLANPWIPINLHPGD